MKATAASLTQALIFVISLCFTTMPVAASILAFKYSGSVTIAENFSSGIPGSPMYSTHVGELFHGNFSLNTNDISIDPDEGFAMAPLASINFLLPDQGFSEDFSGPGGIVFGNLNTGETEVFGGRPDYGREEVIAVNLPANSFFDPKLLYGKTGSFTFDNFELNGFHIEGRALISAVPEPATWSAMIMGLWLIGTRLRLRRAKAPSTGCA